MRGRLKSPAARDAVPQRRAENRGSRLDRLLGAAFVIGGLARFAVRRRPAVTIEERLAMLPRAGAPVERPVTIRWNRHQVPFIIAESDRDLAAALGVVHAHLRLGQ